MPDSTIFHPLFETFPVLETERFRLRQMDANDAEAVFNIYADDAVTSTTQFVLKTATTALSDATQYVWTYQVIR